MHYNYIIMIYMEDLYIYICLFFGLWFKLRMPVLGDGDSVLSVKLFILSTIIITEKKQPDKLKNKRSTGLKSVPMSSCVFLTQYPYFKFLHDGLCQYLYINNRDGVHVMVST